MAESPVPFDLAFLCKVLSPWTGEEEALRLREAARSEGVNWEAVARLANRANLAPALRAGLNSRQLWQYAPSQLRDYLNEVYRFNGERNALLYQELTHVVRLLNEAGIVPLPLKGAAALATGLFADPATRFMWDLDVLVPAGRIRDAVFVLEEGGYLVSEQYSTAAQDRKPFYEAKHFAPLVREGGPASIELHRLVVSDERSGLLDTEVVWEESSLPGSTLLPGVSVAMMSPTHQILHCFIHSELEHANHRDWRLDLRQLHHFAALCLRYRNTVDWGQIGALQQKDHAGPALRTYLHLARKLFGIQIPLSMPPDDYAERHARRTLFLSQGKLKWLRILRDILDRSAGCLSEERMRMAYPLDTGSPTKWRRIQRLGELLGRFSRWEVWKEMIDGMSRRYDSLG